MSFVRKTLLTISGRFWVDGNDNDADDPTPMQPVSVTAALTYCNMAGEPATTTIALALNPTTGKWSGTWDSSAAKHGRVDWVVYSAGNSIQGATEGFFMIDANRANVV